MATQIVRMIAAWLFTNFAFVIGYSAWKGQGVTRLSDGLLGIGLIVGLPMLLFAGVTALPLAFLVQRFFQPTVGAIFFPFLIGGIAWLLTYFLSSGGWRGAHQAVFLFAFVLGLSWSLLGFIIPRSN
ncbi:hypothetical protein [Sphingomonas abietis]|uniref:Uncharacterized protein n=1 Tax=Sphingomonas abietis TaxID=3012344 RepID=A0ABY7NNP7_9SPHN|nr:hypothetical protein [Sphingomonas abietis]WBO22983.1 hypothetical protein PBT88_02245 [Sphingomonas abietis]